MEDVWTSADDLGPAKVIHVRIPAIDLRGTLVVDNVAAGPAIGGLRMASDVSTAECLRLARAMTLKNAAAGLAHGGGKSVLYGDPAMPAGHKEQLVRGLAHALRGEADYIFGPDMGTDETCMAWVKDEIGRSVGLPRELGGIPLDELGATGWGLRHAVEAALERGPFKLRGARLAVQGYGAVGMHAARFLCADGAILVAASDTRGAIENPQGLNVEALTAWKRESGTVADFPGGLKRPADAIIDVECDIWIPAARPDVLHAGNAGRLRAKLVPQGANIPFTAEAEAHLHERGVLVIPDFIANAGGVICAAMEYHGATQAAAFDAIAEKIHANTAAVLASAAKSGKRPREAALALAEQRVRHAMSVRRWSIA